MPQLVQKALDFLGVSVFCVVCVCVFFNSGWFFRRQVLGVSFFFFSVGDLVAEMFGKTPGKFPRWFVPK